MGQHTALQGNSVQVYWEAVDHFHQKKYHAALPLFSRFLQTDGTPTLKENAHFYKAMTRLYLGRPHADMAVKQFVEDYPDNPLAGTAYFELANYFFEKSKFKMAALYYENVEKAQLARRQQMEMTFKRAYANFNLKRFQEALPLFNEIKDLENEWRHDAAYYAGYIEFQNGEYQKAVKDFKQATQNPAYGAALPYMISAVYFNQGDEQSLFSYALPLLEEEKRLDNRAEMQLMLAETYFKQREFEKASQWFDGYLKGKSKASAEVLYRSAFSSLRSGKDEQAVRDFKKVALVKDTLGYLSSYYLGQLYLKQGNKRFAQTAFNAARQGSMSPDIAAESTFNSGKLAFELNNYDQAIRIFREFQEKYPGHKGQEKARELLSQSYLRGREFNKAIREIEKVARRSPSLRLTVQKLTYKKGIEYFNKDRYAEALRYFDKSLAYPESDELQLGARLWRAEARSLQKEYAESIADYQWVLEHGLDESPNKWKATYGLAYAFFNTQDYAQAIAYFKSYVEAMKRQSDPMFYDDALMRLADCYFVQKGYQLSLDLYSQAVQENNPDVDYAYYQIGRVHGIEENYSDAKQYLEKVIQAVPRSNLHDAAVYELASFEASRGDYGSAVNYASSLIKESPQSPRMAEALELRANSYFSLKNFKKSTADYARVLTDYPQATNAQSALLGLQGVLKERGKEEDFPKYLSMYKKANPENEQVQNIEFETVKDLYFSQQYAKAAQRFTSYLIDYPNTPFRVEASYYLADCYYRSNKLEQAAE